MTAAGGFRSNDSYQVGTQTGELAAKRRKKTQNQVFIFETSATFCGHFVSSTKQLQQPSILE